MKKLLLSLVAILSIATVSAQDFSWGVKAGVNLATFTAPGLAPKADFVGGVFGELKTCEWFGVSAEVLYSGQGAKSANENMYNDLYYINVPILANFYVTGNKQLSLKAGIQPGFLTGSRLRSGTETTSLHNVMNVFSLAVPVSIAYELKCGLLFDLRYNIDVINLNKNNDPKVYNSVLAMTVGWRF